jgi:integrase
MKIKNYDKNKDNYILKNKFIFNKYKTSKFYGKQEIIINDELFKLLKKYIKLNPYNSDYLFNNLKGEKLSNITMNQKFNKIFDNKKISINAIRHSYLSKIYKDIPKLENMKNTANNMGHSIEQALLYIQK